MNLLQSEEEARTQSPDPRTSKQEKESGELRSVVEDSGAPDVKVSLFSLPCSA